MPDALDEILETKRQEVAPPPTPLDPRAFSNRENDVMAELIPVRPPRGGPWKTLPRELTFVPNVKPATRRFGLGPSFNLGMVDDPQRKLELAAETMFPDDPNAVRRFGYMNGRPVFVNDKGELENVQGGMVDWLSSFAGRAGPAAAAGTAMVLAAPETGGLSLLGLAALGAAGGEGARKVAANVLLDEPQTVEGNIKSMATEGVLSGAGEALGLGVAAFRSRQAVKGLEDLDVEAAGNLRDALRQKTGIELDLAQVTNNPKLKALKTWARNFPGEASEIVRANDDLIAGQVDGAIQKILDVLSKETDSAAAGLRGINAAEAAIETARAQVAAQTAPIYKQAFAKGGTVDIQPVVDELTALVDGAKGSQQAALRRALNYFFVKQGDEKVLDTSVEGLHATKLALDEMLEQRGTATALGRITRRQIVELKTKLLDAISAASPTYDMARRVYAAESQRLVDPLQNSVVGVLSRVDDAQAATAAARLFNDGNVTPQMMRRARDAIRYVERNDGLEGAWNGLVRQWLGSQFNKAARELQTGSALNVAGKFRQAVIGTQAQKDALAVALEPLTNAKPGEIVTLVDDVMTALQMAARTPTASSATEFNRLITRELEPGGSILRGVMQPRKTVIEGIQQRVLELNATRIAEALTDPTKVSQLRSLQGITSREQRALAAMGIVGLVGGGEAANSILFPPGTQIPQTYMEAQP